LQVWVGLTLDKGSRRVAVRRAWPELAEALDAWQDAEFAEAE